MCIFILTYYLNCFLVLWKQLIQKQGGEITEALDLSSLAKLSDGYTPGHMVRVIRSVVTKHRISQQASKPLTAAEFAAPLAKISPIFQQEEESFKVQRYRFLIFFNLIFLNNVEFVVCQNWYAKTPMGKKRAKAAAGIEEFVEPKSAKKGKK